MHNALHLLSIMLFFRAHLPGEAAAGGIKVRIFLCDTEEAAVAFARHRSEHDVTDDMAGNMVNKHSGRDACNRYIGFVNRQVPTTKLIDGYVFKITRYTIDFTDNRGPRDAWSAERTFDAGNNDGHRDL